MVKICLFIFILGKLIVEESGISFLGKTGKRLRPDSGRSDFTVVYVLFLFVISLCTLKQ